MSGKLVGRCLRDARTQNPSALLVLVAITEYSKDDGLGAALNMATIARETRLSERQARRLVRELEKGGDLSAVAGDEESGLHGSPRHRRVYPGHGCVRPDPGHFRHQPRTSGAETPDIGDHAYRTVEP